MVLNGINQHFYKIPKIPWGNYKKTLEQCTMLRYRDTKTWYWNLLLAPEWSKIKIERIYLLSIHLNKKMCSINSCKMDQSNLIELCWDLSMYISLRRYWLVSNALFSYSERILTYVLSNCKWIKYNKKRNRCYCSAPGFQKNTETYWKPRQTSKMEGFC